jgi:precorrin-6A/cobalt-precorrin-6A reductase
MQLLILGGTGDASILATRAASITNLNIILSLAGRTETARNSNSHNTSIQTRIGGFGGIEGLTNYIQQNSIDLIIDATHPFAAQISYHGTEAARICGIPYLILDRPQWEKEIGDNWIEVETIAEAAKILPNVAKRVFLTIGRQELAAFAHLQDIWFLMRSIDPPQPPIPRGEIILDQAPFALEKERKLLLKYKIEAIVSKNSGGDATYPKVFTARELGIPIIMIKRPSLPQTDRASTVEEALTWLDRSMNLGVF